LGWLWQGECSGTPSIQAWVGQASQGTDSSSRLGGEAQPMVEQLDDDGGFTKGWWLSFVLLGGGGGVADGSYL
jgi:hypothetical protein